MQFATALGTKYGAKYGRRLFAEQATSLQPIDPLYEDYVDTKGRTKSRKREMPTGLSKRDERILRSVRKRAHSLDKGFTLCGFSFGWTAIFGLIPIAGDIISAVLSYFFVLRKCREAELPTALESRMVFNNAVSIGIGLVPIVGDLALAVWKANSRNAALLEEFLIARASSKSDKVAAEIALGESAINAASGERIGGPDYRISEEVMREEPVEVKKGSAWTRFYGWGTEASGSGGGQVEMKKTT